jgi:hypothetical protein
MDEEEFMIVEQSAPKNPGKEDNHWSLSSDPPCRKRGFEKTKKMVLSDDETFETLEDNFRITRVEYETLNED